MKEEVEQQSILFHDRARNVFFSIYREFRHSIATVDRQGDEHKFQQMLNRYTSQLQLQLNTIALELLGQVETTNRNQLNLTLSQSIREYVNEFMQKVKCL